MSKLFSIITRQLINHAVDQSASTLLLLLTFVISTSITVRHILSNVGRVIARDSSRANATVNDLFVALCEDDSIYGLFKNMKG